MAGCNRGIDIDRRHAIAIACRFVFCVALCRDRVLQILLRHEKAGYQVNGTLAAAFEALRFRVARALIQTMWHTARPAVPVPVPVASASGQCKYQRPPPPSGFLLLLVPGLALAFTHSGTQTT
jgi:hypothetical protein